MAVHKVLRAQSFQQRRGAMGRTWRRVNRLCSQRYLLLAVEGFLNYDGTSIWCMKEEKREVGCSLPIFGVFLLLLCDFLLG